MSSLTSRERSVTTVFGILCFCGLIPFVIFIMHCVSESDKSQIREWAAEHGTTAVDIEERFLDIGPYWIKHKNQRVYKVTLKNGQTAWMRTGLFGGDEWIVK